MVFLRPVFFIKDGHYFFRDRETDVALEYPRELWDQLQQEADTTRHRKQAQGKCRVPRNYWAVCDGICPGCPFEVPEVSLSAPDAVESRALVEKHRRSVCAFRRRG